MVTDFLTNNKQVLTITKSERENQAGTVSQHNWLQGVVESKVATSVDNDANAGDDESSVETLYSISLQGLLVDVDETVELSLAALLSALGIVGKPGSGVIERIDEEEGHGTSSTSGGDVLGELDAIAVGLAHLEHGLDLVLESKVEGLGWEVPDAVGHVTAPEGDKTCNNKR